MDPPRGECRCHCNRNNGPNTELRKLGIWAVGRLLIEAVMKTLD